MSSGFDRSDGGGIPGYVNLAAGLGRATRERAASAVRGLLSQVGLEEAADQASERLAHLSDEVLAASRANRELMLKLVAGEVEKVADQLGFARKEELDDLRREVADLRVGLAQQAVRTEQAATVPPARKAPAKKAPAKKAPAKKATAEKATAKKASARQSAVGD